MAELLLLVELLFQPLPHRDLRYEWVVGQRPGASDPWCAISLCEVSQVGTNVHPSDDLTGVGGSGL